jgi:hypothetical protein
MGRIPLLVRMFTIALAVGALAPAGASAWMPEPVQFERDVELRTGAGGVSAAGAPVTTTVRTKRRFDLVGASWRGARDLDVHVRVLREGRWSRWGHAGAPDGPDAGQGEGSSARTHGAPVWAGGASAVQIRLDRPASGLRLNFVNTTGSATRQARARTRKIVAKRGSFGPGRKAPVTNAARPRIVPRSSWGASRCKPRDTPSYGDTRVAYVHHTVSLNGYSRARAAAMVLGVCLFHRNGNGWDDLGYNFLVDRYGTVYEGRAGGVDAPVIGAQAGGFNSESTGVAVIGSYSSSAPPRAAMRSLAKLLAWKLSLHGVPAKGRTEVTSAGSSSTRHPAGAKVTVNRISGHRDVDLTACPGNALYARLPALRREVARLEGATSRLSIAPSSAQVTYGTGATATGLLQMPAAGDAGGARVELRALTGTSSERTLTSTTTAPDGSWTAELPPLTAPQLVRAVFPGETGRPGVVSRPVWFSLLPQITLAAAPAAPHAGDAITASGSVRPAKRSVTVIAYLQRSDGSERRAASKTASAGSGRYRAKLTLKEAGTYRLETRAGADAASGAGISTPATVRVAPAG